MDFCVEPGAGGGRVRLAGELTIYHAAAARDSLLGLLQAGVPLELDLGGVSEIDTAGLQVLMAAKQQARRTGLPLALCNHGAATLALIELYDLAAWLGDPLVPPPGPDPMAA